MFDRLRHIMPLMARMVLLPVMMLVAVSTRADDIVAVAEEVIAEVDSTATVVVNEIVEAPIEATESVVARRSSTRWIKQLIDNGFHINEPGVDYPAFPRFALKVYNWGNRVFNTYDTTYVQATGKNWKLFFKNVNWANNYEMIFNDRTRVALMSDPNADIGGYLCFMAVSVGYMFDAKQLAGRHVNPRTGFNFNFTCARFSGDIMLSNVKGDAKILRFGDYRNGALLNMPFDDISNKTLSAKVFYFFNHNRYSHAAAYCFSKYQLKSAGTWIAGLNFANQEISLNFENLPEDMLHRMPELLPNYYFHYRDYYLLGGYAHNWVLKPRRWLINVTAMPAVGYKHTYEDSTDNRHDIFGANFSGLASVVYNNRQMFVSLQGRFDLYMYTTPSFTFFNTYEQLLATVGVRF